MSHDRLEKDLLICHAIPRFPLLTQTKPQASLWVVPPQRFLSFFTFANIRFGKQRHWFPNAPKQIKGIMTPDCIIIGVIVGITLSSEVSEDMKKAVSTPESNL